MSTSNEFYINYNNIMSICYSNGIKCPRPDGISLYLLDMTYPVVSRIALPHIEQRPFL